MARRFSHFFLTGILLLVPAWATLLILSTLLHTLNQWVRDLVGHNAIPALPGFGLALFCLLVMIVGAIATHVVGRQLIVQTERWIERIPLVRSIYLTVKGITDLFNFRSRFGRSTVVAFPFPRDGLWALGFVMGTAPVALQITPTKNLLMIFVPTAIHPFTGYLAFVPKEEVRPTSLPPEDAMKMEFSAGLYRPERGWLRPPEGIS